MTVVDEVSVVVDCVVWENVVAEKVVKLTVLSVVSEKVVPELVVRVDELVCVVVLLSWQKPHEKSHMCW